MKYSYPITTRNLFCVILILCIHKNLFSQCSSDGPRDATTFISQSFSGSDYSWNNASNVAGSDNSRATASAFIGVLSGETDYLKATGFGFSLSAFVTICGIQVEVEKSGSNIGVLASIQDYSVRLVKNNVLVGNDKATGTDAYYTYGGTNDTWGTTWTVSDINSSDFGIAFSSQLSGAISLLPTSRLDHIRITVYYSNITLPVDLISFNAVEKTGQVHLNWETAETTERAHYIVQRSAHGNEWMDLTTIDARAEAANAY